MSAVRKIHTCRIFWQVKEWESLTFCDTTLRYGIWQILLSSKALNLYNQKYLEELWTNHKDTSKTDWRKITQQEVTWEYLLPKEDNKRRHQFFRFIFIQFSCDLYWIFPFERCMRKGIVFLSMENFNKDYTIISLLLPLIEFKWFWVERRWKNRTIKFTKRNDFLYVSYEGFPSFTRGCFWCTYNSVYEKREMKISEDP